MLNRSFSNELDHSVLSSFNLVPMQLTGQFCVGSSDGPK